MHPVDVARELTDLIRAHRDDTESERRLAGPIVSALREARLCRTALPKELDGLDLDPVATLELYEVLAGAEASVPWIAWNNALVSYLSRFLTPAVRAELFGDPHWLYAQSTRPSGIASATAGGFRVSGRWSLVSGCELAEWLLLLCQVEESGTGRDVGAGAETRFVMVRRGDFEIVDTWHVGGLRGTGSHDVVVTDAFVAGHHTLSPADGCSLEGPLGRLPIIATTSAGFAAQALGVARAALDAVVATARSTVRPGPTPDLRDRAAAQSGVALHAAALGAARCYLHERLDAAWQQARAGTPCGLEAIGDVYGAALHATETARLAVDAMYGLGGTRALYTDSPLERAHRDLRAMLQHIVAQPLWAEDAGRVCFGLPPENPLYAV